MWITRPLAQLRLFTWAATQIRRCSDMSAHNTKQEECNAVKISRCDNTSVTSKRRRIRAWKGSSRRLLNNDWTLNVTLCAKSGWKSVTSSPTVCACSLFVWLSCHLFCFLASNWNWWEYHKRFHKLCHSSLLTVAAFATLAPQLDLEKWAKDDGLMDLLEFPLPSALIYSFIHFLTLVAWKIQKPSHVHNKIRPFFLPQIEKNKLSNK